MELTLWKLSMKISLDLEILTNCCFPPFYRFHTYRGVKCPYTKVKAEEVIKYVGKWQKLRSGT